MNEYQQIAHTLHGFGFNCTAIETGTKRPGHPWVPWQTVRQSLDDLNRLPWRGAAGVGVICGVGGLRTFDFDKCPDFAPVAMVLEVLGLPP